MGKDYFKVENSEVIATVSGTRYKKDLHNIQWHCDRNSEKFIDDYVEDVLGNGDIILTIIDPGLNIRPNKGDQCTMQLLIKNEVGEVIEESDKTIFIVGELEVITGLELATPLINIQSTCEIVVKSRFAYGQLGIPEKLGPNETITILCYMISICSPPDISSLPLETRCLIAERKKERGNWWMQRNECYNAMLCYQIASRFCDLDSFPVLTIDSDSYCMFEVPCSSIEKSKEEKVQSLHNMFCIISNNLALAQMKLDQHSDAANTLDKILYKKPKDVKALFKRGKIHKIKGDYNEAVVNLREAYRQCLTNEIRVELQECLDLQEKSRKQQTVLFQKMCRNMYSSENIEVRPDSPTSENVTNHEHPYRNYKYRKLDVFYILSLTLGITAVIYMLISK